MSFNSDSNKQLYLKLTLKKHLGVTLDFKLTCKEHLLNAGPPDFC